jgi:hypothetical protein
MVSGDSLGGNLNRNGEYSCGFGGQNSDGMVSLCVKSSRRIQIPNMSLHIGHTIVRQRIVDIN